jgi:hypothetical protein
VHRVLGYYKNVSDALVLMEHRGYYIELTFKEYVK